MQFKSFLLSLLGVAALLIPAQACVHFTATRSRDRPIYNLNAHLVDNGQEVCWYDGDYDSCGGCEQWDFTCFQGNFAAIAFLVDDGGSIDIEYSNPGGNFRFNAPVINGGLLEDEHYDTYVYC